MTQEKDLRAKWRPRRFAIITFHFSLGAGVTPAEGSLKPTVGFISIKFFLHVPHGELPSGLCSTVELSRYGSSPIHVT